MPLARPIRSVFTVALAASATLSAFAQTDELPERLSAAENKIGELSELRFHADLQWDGRFFLDDEAASKTNSFSMRRARLFADGTFANRNRLFIRANFNNGAVEVQDAYLRTTFAPFAVVTVGKQKSPVGLERLRRITETTFVELGYPTSLVPNRDIGAALSGSLTAKQVEYAVGAFNGVPDGGSADADANDGKEVAFRVFAQPSALKGFGFGLGGSVGTESSVPSAPNLTSFRTASSRLTFFRFRSDGEATGTVVADGRRLRMTPQASYFNGPVSLLAEYARVAQDVRLDAATDTLTHEAWQIAATYVFGGTVSYRDGVVPTRAFDPASGGWGAWELALRVGELRADEASFPMFADPAKSAQSARSWTLGLTWVWDKRTKTVLNVERTTFKGYGVADPKPESVVLTRVQAQL